MSRRDPPAGQDGFVTVQFALAVGLSLVLVTMVANLIVLQYGRGVVRAALDEGVRAASRVDADPAACIERAEGVLDDLLGGDLRAGVALRCDGATAVADVTFAAWLPGMPAWTFTLAADAVAEEAP